MKKKYLFANRVYCGLYSRCKGTVKLFSSITLPLETNHENKCLKIRSFLLVIYTFT